MYRSYKLLKTVWFFDHPVAVILKNADNADTANYGCNAVRSRRDW